MKNMKLIMENFRKNMKEGWPGEPKVEVPWANADKEANAEKMDSWMQQSRESREKEDVLTRAAAQATEDILRDFVANFAIFKQKRLWNKVKKTILFHADLCQHKRAIKCL